MTQPKDILTEFEEKDNWPWHVEICCCILSVILFPIAKSIKSVANFFGDNHHYYDHTRKAIDLYVF